MTYHREYDDPRFQGGGFTEYPSTLQTRPGDTKWTILTVAAIFAILGAFILFPREAPVDAQTSSSIPAPVSEGTPAE